MNIQFNPDGSIKLPEQFAKRKQDLTNKMNNARCIVIDREIVSTYSPKQCRLSIKTSKHVNQGFIENVYKYFTAQTPMKLKQISETEFHVEIGTDFRRCSDCTALISRLRNALNGHIIVNQGTCTFKQKQREFCFEDYFD
ncbi:MAG: hypothetical protein U9R08_02300 [Nanoarchaeota archaeon]|nr:hypothetical protein [Nanoarchaeota archaeon]